MSKVNIVFQNQNIFFPGHPIPGYVEVILANSTACKEITIKLYGFARVQFSVTSSVHDSQTNRTTTRTNRISSSENYYSLQYKLWGDGINSQDLPAGTQHYPFTFILPPTTPSSFESQYGSVCHNCEAEVVLTKFYKWNLKCVTPFSVISTYDLNFDQYAQHPISDFHDKTFCCLCCTSGPVSFTVNIDHRGFVPGENIIINAECVNKSNKTIAKSRAEVVQIICYKAQGHFKSTSKVVCFKERPQILPGKDDIWASEPLLIPSLPSSNLNGCNIIDIRYVFGFKLIPSGAAMNLESETDIIIGTIPLQRLFNQFVSFATPQAVSGPSIPMSSPKDRIDKNIENVTPADLDKSFTPSAPPLIFPGSDNYPDLPPPSYEESVFGQKGVSPPELEKDSERATGANNDDEFELPDDRQFSPRYVTYKMSPRSNQNQETEN